MIPLIYFLLLGLACYREVPELWRRGARREAAVWVAIALAAAGLTGWLFWEWDTPGWAELFLY